MYCIAEGLLSRLQSVQNTTARYWFRTAGTHNTCPAAAPLVAVRQRVMFKLATLVYRSLAGTAPAYLSDEFHLTSSVGVRSLRSADSRTRVPRHAHNGIRCSLILPLPFLGCGTVCRCSFENRTFRSTVLKLYWRRFCYMWRRSRHSATNR